MKTTMILYPLAAAVLLLGAVPAHAETIKSADGVLSIETPSEEWAETMDPNHWFVISDGNNSIIVDHLSNGENLPADEVAGSDYAAVYQANVSTRNEVFAVKGQAHRTEDLQEIMTVIGTIKILKYDTKTAVAQTPAPQISEFALRPIDTVYYVTSPSLNVRSGCSTDDALLGTLVLGDQVRVNGAVTRNGEDYGWYQIQFYGASAYVASEFLSLTRPATVVVQPQATTAPKPYPVSSGFAVYDAYGFYQGTLTLYSDGYYYTESMERYQSDRNGRYHNGTRQLFDYLIEEYEEEPVIEFGTGRTEPYALASGFTVYDAYGNNQGKLRPFSDGLYYSNDMIPYVDNGDGSYTGAGETLYDELP